MKYWLVLVQWMVLVTAVAAPGKAPRKPAPEGNRFLFVLETSLPMAKLEHGGRQAVFDLIYSGVEGRMRKGDTFGVWTFNAPVQAGVYPMQIWDGQRKLEHASSVGRFLKTQKYEKDGNLTNLVAQLQSVVRVAKDLNVFIVTDGNSTLSGTPFDAEVNAAYRTHAAQVRATKAPLITTLTARNGQFTAACVTVAGENIMLADLPPQIDESAELAAKAATETNAPAATPAKAPLGQVIWISDAEAQAKAARAKATNAALAATKPVSVETPAVVEPSKPEAVKSDTPLVTNVVEEPVLVASTASATVSNVVSTPVKQPMTTASAPVAAIEEPAPPGPEPLPAIVPAQLNVLARSASDVVKTPGRALGGNLMLMLGGVFVGASLVGAGVFARRMRKAKQPSFISQGMERE